MSKFKKLINIYKNANVIVRAGIWFLLVTIIDKSISVITQPIINRILTVDQVGVFGVYNSWRSIFSVLATFNLFGGVLEVNLTKDPKKKDGIVASLCTLSLFISIVFWTVFFVFGDKLSALLGLKKIYLFFMAMAITSEATIQFWTVPKRFEYSYKPYAVLVVGLFFTKSFLSVILTYFMRADRVLGRILGLAIPAIVVALFLLAKILAHREHGKLLAFWKSGFLFNLPLIPHYLSSIMLASSDKVMIQQLSGESEVGLYTVAYSFSSLALIVFNALNSTYNPLSMRAIKDKNYTTLQKSTELMVLLSVFFSVFMMLLAPEGIWLLGGSNYLITVDIIPVLIVGIYFSSFYFIFSNVEFVYEKNKMIFPITLIGATTNIVLNYLMIPVFGYIVAAYTTFIGYLIIAVSHYLVSRKIIGGDIYNIKRLLGIVAMLLIGGGASLILYDLPNLIRYIFMLIVFIVLAIVLYKNKATILKSISKKASI